MAREQYEEVAFQVVTNEYGDISSGWFPTGAGIVDGNIAVDYVWGNFPLQPNDDRNDQTNYYGGGEGDNGWYSTATYDSDTLQTNDYSVEFNNVGGYVDVPADSHTIATTGYSNYPGYIPNYAGDGDTGLEVQVPNLVRKSLDRAQELLDPLDLNLFAVSHNIGIGWIETFGTTVRISGYDPDWDQWGGNGYPNSQLVGIRKGDQLALSITGDDYGVINFGSYVTVSNVNVNGENSWFEFVWTEDLGLDELATGTVYAGPNLVDKVLLQRSLIRNEGQQVNVRYLGE